MKRLGFAALGLLLLSPTPAQKADAAFAIFQTARQATVTTCPDFTPVLAAAFSASACAFYDSMADSTKFDLDNTGAAGFNWYMQNNYCEPQFTGSISGTTLTVTAMSAQNFCNIAAGMTIGRGATGTGPTPATKITALGTGSGGTGTYVVSPSQTMTSQQVSATFAQPGGSLTFSASGVSINNVGQGTNNYGIGSTYISDRPAGSAPFPYHGTSFKGGPVYIRAYIGFDKSKSPNPACSFGLSACRWPAWWHVSFPGEVLGQAFLEVDTIDALPGGPSTVAKTSFLHEWTGGSSVDSNFPAPTNCTLTFDGVAFNTMDFLWVPTTSNGGAGIYAFAFNADSCGGNAVIKGHIIGTTLTVESVISGTVAANSYIAGDTTVGNTKIIGGSGTTWTVNNSQTVASNTTIVVANGNACVYYLSANQNCSDSPASGGFSSPETLGSGFNMILSSGCSAVVVTTPPDSNCDYTTHAGDWPLLVKNVQVWCTDSSCKQVQ